MDGSAPVRVMDSAPLRTELNRADRKKDYDYTYTLHELADGANSLPPVELG